MTLGQIPGRHETKHHVATLRHRITVRRAVETLDSARQPVVTWFDRYTKEPAKYVQVRGGEVFRGRQIEPNVSAVFTVNKREYAETDRIVFDGQTYGIVWIDRAENVARYLELHCQMVPA